jgi:hypothetical protein
LKHVLVALMVALVSASVLAEEVVDPYGPPTPAAPANPSGNDFRWKVLFKFNVNYQFDDAGLSGAAALALKRPTVPGADGQAAALASQADYLSSDHVLGTEGLGWSHLRLYYNGFLLHRFEDGAQVIFPTAYLKGDQQTAYDVRAGYAEIDGFKDKGFWSKAYLRAGRQFRYGAGIATFDGLTLGYRGPAVEAALWGGRRSPRFLDDTDPGFVAGADVTVHLDAVSKVAIDLAADYLTYFNSDVNSSFTAHHLLVLSGKWRMKSGGKLILSVSSYDFQGARVYLGLSHPLGRVAQLKVYYDLKLGRDLTYDYISGFGMSASRYFTLPDTEDRSRFGVRVDHEIGRRFEYAVAGTVNLVHGDGNIEGARGWTGPTAFDATYEELSVTARALLPRGFTPEAEYRIRFVQRIEEKGLFSDSSQAGEHQMQEVRGDLRLRPYTGLSFQVGAVYRVRDYTTRYAPTGQATTVENDTTIAAELSAEAWIRRVFLVRARYEVGTDSNVFAPELALIQTLYATVGGKF